MKKTNLNSGEFAIIKSLPQSDRLKRLNEIAIRQMKTLTARAGVRSLSATLAEKPL